MKGWNQDFRSDTVTGNVKLECMHMGVSDLDEAAAAAAKSRQLCPTLCDPMDCSLPGPSVHGIFQATVLEWGAIA